MTSLFSATGRKWKNLWTGAEQTIAASMWDKTEEIVVDLRRRGYPLRLLPFSRFDLTGQIG